ncbi:MAG: tetratricopeptide repeat protein [Nitrospirota bacterium]
MKKILSFRAFLIILAVVALSSFAYQVFLKGSLIKDFNLILLLILCLIAILLSQYGSDLLSRVRKIGILELATGEKISQVLSYPLPPKENPFLSREETGPSLTPQEKDHYEQINDFLLLVAARGIEPQHMDKPLKEGYEKALLYGGRYSFLNGEYLRSIRLLEMSRKIFGVSPEILSHLANAYLWAGCDSRDKNEKNEYLKKAIELYEHAIASRKAQLDHFDYYHLGWAYDEIGLFEKAIENYLNVIKIKENYFDAHYNIAASYAKWNKYKESIEWLGKVPREVLEGIQDDSDFNELREDTEYGEKYRELLTQKGLNVSSSSYNE